ncbi:hypothetical protein SBV1_1520012 [Verrucomicrobia bacterium]|nr:hypothetical protein SBV1_1520012 [Verrucomicrobiota bacterium]
MCGRCVGPARQPLNFSPEAPHRLGAFGQQIVEILRCFTPSPRRSSLAYDLRLSANPKARLSAGVDNPRRAVTLC